MGAAPSRESEVAGRLVDSIEDGHLHTLQLLLKFIQHCEGGAPATQISAARSKGLVSVAAGGNLLMAPQVHIPLSAEAKIRRPPPPSLSNQVLDPQTAAFHARAAALAQQQALAAGLQSASFPIPMDLNSLTLRSSGDALIIAAVKKDQPHVIRLLAEAGIDLDVTDYQLYTALHHAAQMHRVGCLNQLLQQRAFALAHSRTGLLPSQCTPHKDIARRLQMKEIEDQLHLFQLILSEPNGELLSYAQIAAHPLMDSSSSSNYPFHLYRVECSPELVGSGNVETEVFFRAPAVRSSSDCICLYYVDDVNQPWVMRPRVGSVWYLSERRKMNNEDCIPPSVAALNREAHSSPSSAASSSSMINSSCLPASVDVASLRYLTLGWDSITINIPNAGSLPTCSYRFVFFDSCRQQVMAASDLFTIRIQYQVPPPSAATIAAAGVAASSSSSGPVGSPIAPAASTAARKGSNAAAPAPVLTSIVPPHVANSNNSAGLFSFLPSIWPASSAAPSPGGGVAAGNPVVALHPNFHQLSDGTPENISAFAQPPPNYYRSHFLLNSAAVTLALQLDSRLGAFRDTFTRSAPPQMKEEEFWIRYFYRMSKLDEQQVEKYPAPNTPAVTQPAAPTTTYNTILTAAPSPSLKPTVAPTHTQTVPSSSYTAPTSSVMNTPAVVASTHSPVIAPTSSYQPPSAALPNKLSSGSDKASVAAAAAAAAAAFEPPPMHAQPLPPASKQSIISAATAAAAAFSPPAGHTSLQVPASSSCSSTPNASASPVANSSSATPVTPSVSNTLANATSGASHMPPGPSPSPIAGAANSPASVIPASQAAANAPPTGSPVINAAAGVFAGIASRLSFSGSGAPAAQPTAVPAAAQASTSSKSPKDDEEDGESSYVPPSFARLSVDDITAKESPK